MISDSNLNLESEKTYLNADTLRLTILSENKNKSGIYRWINLLNGKSYVGSSINLHRIFKDYFSIYFLENEGKKNNSKIYRALLKNGYSNFKL